MSGMVAWGTMGAVIGSGARDRRRAADRLEPPAAGDAAGGPVVPAGRVATGYALALVSMAAIYTAAVGLGVRLPADRWVAMTAMVLVGLVPFAVIGIFLGHVISAESIGPAIGGLTSLFALLAGPTGRWRAADSCGRWPSACRRTGWCRPVTSRSTAGRGRPRRGSC